MSVGSTHLSATDLSILCGIFSCVIDAPLNKIKKKVNKIFKDNFLYILNFSS